MPHRVAFQILPIKGVAPFAHLQATHKAITAGHPQSGTGELVPRNVSP